MAGIAILGAGIFAREEHLPALIKAKANILAVYSRSTASAKSLIEAASNLGTPTSQITIYADELNAQNQGLPDLLARQDIKAVVIALPILVQPDVVRKCLVLGKHVLCEKPIAKNIQSGLDLVTEYERDYRPKGLIFSIAEQARFDLALTRAKELVASGKIGKLNHVHSRLWTNTLPGENKWYETEWRKKPEYQGGFVLDAGVHMIALLRFVSGQEITKTASLVQQVYPHLPPLDTVNAGIMFSGGATGSLSISFASSKNASEYLFVGESGTVSVNWSWGKNKVVLEDKQGRTVVEEIDGLGVEEEVKAFLMAVRDGKADPRGEIREALADVAVIESICSGGGVVQDYMSSAKLWF
ncbi:hypothetical protein PHISCL_02654 [Aspergillus sclerotialis]|uniref:Oxidoreductase n=1 Tax=Aspergillus sclerotialis TaxID=2070753 RepID=A0A3A2ZRQ1_9EURO|nr:hypothetical protein PHISCL_02654 [Aspergillus sclerotialis]